MDTKSKLNVHKTCRRRPKHLLNVLFAFNLRPMSRGIYDVNRNISIRYAHIWTCFTYCLLLSLKTFVLKNLKVVVLNKKCRNGKFFKAWHKI